LAQATELNSRGYLSTGVKYSNGTTASYGASFTTNDVIGIAVDVDGGTVAFYKNGTSQGTAYSDIAGKEWFVTVQGGNTSAAVMNFGQRPFTYTPPTGYNALCTYNLPTPTIANGALYNAATLYTGTGSALSIVNSQSNGGNNPLGKTFYSDFVWQKCRNAAANNFLADSVRGVNKELLSDSTAAEFTSVQYVTSFNSNGVSFGNDTGLNTNGNTYVAWQWNAGSGSSSSNTNGSITSTVSVNATAGFSIVTYSGTGSTGTVGHGLGVAPSMFIVKSRTYGSGGWSVYHTSIGATGAVQLNSTSATVTSSNYWNNTGPTSSVFTVSGASAELNGAGNTYVAYCFAAVKGYSSMGSYSGNGSADGPFIYTGFRPRWVMIKRTDAVQNWPIIDTSRDTYNVSNKRLFANLSDAEDTGIPNFIDILSNGFKCRFKHFI
jgi:hypothetical protein